MKLKIAISALLVFFVLSTINLSAQTTPKPYSEGSVWQVSFVKLKPNMGDEYLKNLATTWRKAHEEAIKQGIIIGYKVLRGAAANPEDWDIMLMANYKNMGAMDNTSEKWDAIFKTVIGTEDQQKTLNQNRISLRDIYGAKITREILFN